MVVPARNSEEVLRLPPEVRRQLEIELVDDIAECLAVALVTKRRSRVREALADGASPDSRDEEGRTALHVAVACGRGDAVRVLAESGADLEAAESSGSGLRPLHLACTAEDANLLRFLLERESGAARPGCDRTSRSHRVGSAAAGGAA